MKINRVNINNYKSIKEIEIPFQVYGEGASKSNTTFLVGINESGKTAILEALSFINTGLELVDYDSCCFKPAYDDNSYIDIFIHLETENSSYWQKRIIEKCAIPDALSRKIKFKSIVKNIFKDAKGAYSQYKVKIENLSCYEYLVETIQQTVNSKVINTEKIKLIKEANHIQEIISESNAMSFLSDNQEILTQDKIEEILSEKLYSVFEINLPKVLIWKAKPEYLINSIIDLDVFKETPDISLPLKYMFNLIGKDTNDKIKIAIERALKSQEKSDELKDHLTDAVTRTLNKKWKEHKVKLLVSINGSNCQVQVQDKDAKNKYYTFHQRSDGFKQFVSLILSLSLLNDSNKLVNNLILIDEPEIYLHPSGVMEMRDEILKIGHNNKVFVATHSHYMIDTTCPERHWIVKKEKSQTSIIQINECTPIEDDAVISAAFGLNLFKELLPKNILVVEGNDDKIVFLHCLGKIANKFFYTIKSAGGASKMPGIAAMLNNERVPAFFLFDDDKEGVENKKKILDNYKDYFNSNNVFTIRDIESTIPQKSTIEDLMPPEFVKDFFKNELSKEFNIEESKPIINQLKSQDSRLNEKQKLDSLKLKLAKKYLEKYETKALIEAQSLKMNSFINKLIELFNNQD
jgi:predicted ATP-dependent endonuclease of OLD family